MKKGFTLIEVMIVVTIIGLLAAIAIPNFVMARAYSNKNACAANLKQLDGAKATWAREHKKAVGDIPEARDIYGTSAYIRDMPHCPDGGVYDIGKVGEYPTCSYKPSRTNLWHVLPPK